MKTWVQIPRTQEDLGVAAHACHISTGVEQRRADLGGLVGQPDSQNSKLEIQCVRHLKEEGREETEGKILMSTSGFHMHTHALHAYTHAHAHTTQYAYHMHTHAHISHAYMHA